MSERYDEIMKIKVDERSMDTGNKLNNRMLGILIGYTQICQERDGWMDVITTGDALGEMIDLLFDVKKGMYDKELGGN